MFQLHRAISSTYSYHYHDSYYFDHHDPCVSLALLAIVRFQNGDPCLVTRPLKFRFAVPEVHVNRSMAGAEEPNQKMIFEALPCPFDS